MVFQASINADQYSLFPLPNSDDNPVVYVTRTTIDPIRGPAYSANEIAMICSRPSIVDLHETVKSGQSKNISSALRKIHDRSRYNLFGKQEFRLVQCPPGTELVYESIAITLQKLDSRHHFGEADIVAWNRATDNFRRLHDMFDRHPLYNGPGAPNHLRFSHNSYSGLVDGRIREEVRSYGMIGISRFYLVRRPLPTPDLDYLHLNVPRFAVTVDVVKCGSTYQTPLHQRMMSLAYSMKSESLLVSSMDCNNAALVEQKVKDAYSDFRRIYTQEVNNQMRPNQIGEFIRNTPASNPQHVVNFVNSAIQNDQHLQNIQVNSHFSDWTYEHGPTYTHSLTLCIMSHTQIVNDAELQTIVAKINFSDPNEVRLWQDFHFRQAPVSLKLRCIRNSGSEWEVKALDELESRFGIQPQNQYDWRRLRNWMLANYPNQVQLLNTWTRQDFMLHHLKYYP
jgi:hypothetical protein